MRRKTRAMKLSLAILLYFTVKRKSVRPTPCGGLQVPIPNIQARTPYNEDLIVHDLKV